MLHTNQSAPPGFSANPFTPQQQTQPLPQTHSLPQPLEEALNRHNAGDLSGARALYLDMIDSPELTTTSLYHLSRIAFQKGDLMKASGLLQIVLRIAPENLMFYSDLALVFEKLGNYDASLSVLTDLICRLYDNDKKAEAIEICWKIIERAPLHYAAWVNLGTCLCSLSQAEKAVPCLIQAAHIYGRFFPDVESFIADFEKKLASKLSFSTNLLPAGKPVGPILKIEDALTTLGKSMCDLSFIDESIACFKQVVKLEPGFALGHWNLALALLEKKQWEEGWLEYEWRWSWEKFSEVKRILPAPTWRGESLKGKRILVWSEQGYGDGIQFFPLIFRLQKLGAEVIFECPKALVRLISHSLKGVTVITRPENSPDLAPCPPLDYVIPTLGIPTRINLKAEELPLAVNYVEPMPEDVKFWATKIGPSLKTKARVGVVWAGQKSHSENLKRSMSSDTVKKLLNLQSAQLYSLQIGERQNDLKTFGADAVIDLAPYISDFADTAAAIANLDIIIAVDTAVAHLAGAMGKEVWVLLPYVADWRWLEAHDVVAWYPSMRLFRQKKKADWDEVVNRIDDSLQKWRKKGNSKK
jgi:tetratricopeptide (TPR) repeat protein